MAAATAMTEALPALALQAWLSPAYPVGSYAYSHGLEAAAENNTVNNQATLAHWINDNLRHGAGWNDAVLMVETARRYQQQQPAGSFIELAPINELACAMSGTAELQQESMQQGAAFLSVTRQAWPHADIERFAEQVHGGVAYSVCFALAACAHEIDIRDAVRGYLFAMIANWVSAAVRMNIIGQTAGQQLAASFATRIEKISADAMTATLDDLGGCVFLNDIASFNHESQHARLFRS